MNLFNSHRSTGIVDQQPELIVFCNQLKKSLCFIGFKEISISLIQSTKLVMMMPYSKRKERKIAQVNEEKTIIVLIYVLLLSSSEFDRKLI